MSHATFFELKPKVDIVVKKIVRQPWAKRVGSIEDIRQEAYVAVLRAFRTFRADHPRANLQAYVLQCVWNHIRAQSLTQSIVRVPTNMMGPAIRAKRPVEAAHARRALGVRSMPEKGYEPSAPDKPHPIILQDALASITPFQREVLSSCFGVGVEKCSPQEFARRRHTCPKRVYAARRKGLERLREIFA